MLQDSGFVRPQDVNRPICVSLLYRIEGNEDPQVVGQGEYWRSADDISDEGNYMLHGHNVRSTQSENHDVCLLRNIVIRKEFSELPYIYGMPENEEEPKPVKLGEVSPHRRYPWEFDMLKVVQSASGTTDMSSAVVSLPERGLKDLLEGKRKRKEAVKRSIEEVEGAGEEGTVKKVKVSEGEEGPSTAEEASKGEPEEGGKVSGVPGDEDGSVAGAKVGDLPETGGADAAGADVGTVSKDKEDVDVEMTDAKAVAEVLDKHSDVDEVHLIEENFEDAAPLSESDMKEAAGLGNFDEKDYKEVMVQVDITKVKFLDEILREIRPDHVTKLKESIKSSGYRISTGRMSVASKDLGKIAKLFESDGPSNGTRFYGDCLTIDGHHRMKALNQILEEKKAAGEIQDRDVWYSVMLMVRKDDVAMTDREILSLGAVLNKNNHLVATQSFVDNIHSTMSHIRIHVKEYNRLHPGGEKTVKDFTPKEYCRILKSMRSLPSVSLDQYVRYASLARRLIVSNLPASILRDYPQLGFVHITNDVFYKASTTKMRMILDCLQAYLEKGKARGSGEKQGPFESVKRQWYKDFDEYYRSMKRLGEVRGWTVEETLQKPLQITKSHQNNVRTVMVNRMSLFVDTSRGAKKALYTGRITSLSNTMNQRFPLEDRSGTVAPSSTKPPVFPTSHGVDGKAGVSTRSSRRENKPVANKSADSNETVDAPLAPVPGQPSRPNYKETRPSKGKKAKSKKKDVPKPTVGFPSTGSSAPPAHPSDKKKQAKPAEVVDVDAHYDGKDGAEDVGYFDDSLAKELPLGHMERSPYSGRAVPDWVRFAKLCPYDWPKENPIRHVDPLLTYLFIPKEHRSRVLLTPNDLKWIHHDIWRRAGMEELGEMDTVFRRSVLLPYDEIPEGYNPSNIPRNKLDLEDRFAITSEQKPEFAGAYMGKKRAELRKQGYTVFKNGMFLTKQVHEDLCLRFNSLQNEDMFEELCKYFKKKISVEDMKRLSPSTDWNYIVNNPGKADEEERQRGTGRITTTPDCIKRSEQDKENPNIAKYRAMLDVYIAFIARILEVDEGTSRRDVQVATDRLVFPQSGGRFLGTGPGAKAQAWHTDYDNTKDREFDYESGYFIITTFNRPSCLWVIPNSDQFLPITESDAEVLSKFLKPKLVPIPSHSIFFGRGSLIHAGPGYEDNLRVVLDEDRKKNEASFFTRYHIYLRPASELVKDAIHLIPGLEVAHKDHSKGMDSIDLEKGEQVFETTDEEEDEEEDSSDSGGEDEKDGASSDGSEYVVEEEGKNEEEEEKEEE